MRSTHLRTALVVALLATSSGCAGGGTATGQSPSAAPTTPVGTGPAAPTAPVTAGTSAAPSIAASASEAPSTTRRVLVRRTGGFAGRDDTVTVEPDGRWSAVDRAGNRRTGRLPTADLTRLRSLAADPRIGEGGARSPGDAGGNCSDTFAYELTVDTATVRWTECPSQGPPPEAAAALAALVFTATG